MRDAGLISQSYYSFAIMLSACRRSMIRVDVKEKTLKQETFKSGEWHYRMPEWAMLISPAQPLQTENGRWIVFKWVRGTKRAEFVDGKTAVVPRCKVRFLTYPFQRTAISGNSFHSLKSCCVGFNGRNAHPQANNTW